jgi:hypothetical protein
MLSPSTCMIRRSVGCERSLADAAPSDDDLSAMRRAAWRQQGVVVLRPEDIRDDWTRQALINEANRLYGRRLGGER